jgi:hypothetical protein
MKQPCSILWCVCLRTDRSSCCAVHERRPNLRPQEIEKPDDN